MDIINHQNYRGLLVQLDLWVQWDLWDLMGPMGFNGEQGPTGPEGIQGIQGIPGPQGVEGPMGPQGIEGPTGPEGISPSIEVGQTITGEPGTNASVVDLTGSPNHVLEFTIPRGDPGITNPTYGGLYNNGTQFLEFTSPDTYIPIALYLSMPSSNVDASNSVIHILENGIYEINYNLLISSSAQVDIAVCILNNGIEIVPTRISQTMTLDSASTLSNDARVNVSTIVYLDTASNLTLDIKVLRILPNNLSMIINGNGNCTFSVKKLN